MSHETRVVIPSRGRASRMTSLAMIPERWWPHVLLLVPEQEVGEYREALAQKGFGRVQVAGLRYSHLEEKRQYILEQAADNAGAVIIMDDDLRFAARLPDGKFTTAQSEDVGRLLDWMWGQLTDGGKCWVGVSNRFMANTKPLEYETGAPSMIWGFRADVAREHNIRFDHFKSCGEWHVCLSMLEAGLPSINTTRVVVSGSEPNTFGGCLAYRNAQTIREDYERFAAMHPRTAKLVETDRVQQGCDVGVGLRVQWKRAHKLASP